MACTQPCQKSSICPAYLSESLLRVEIDKRKIYGLHALGRNKVTAGTYEETRDTRRWTQHKLWLDVGVRSPLIFC